MLPNIVQLAKNNPSLVTLLGDNPFRFFAFGDAGENKSYPYVTYQVATGSPENYLSGRPDADAFTLQVDCWARTELEVEQVAAQVRYALEMDSYITGYGGGTRDPVTRNYRLILNVDFSYDR